jgi:hypothetical protein
MDMKSKLRLVASALLCTTLIGACAKAEEPAVAQEPAAATAEAAADGRAVTDAVADRPMRRKLVQNAELRLEVASYAELRSELDAALERLGGFVADARVEHHDGTVSRAELILRIPSEKLAEVMAETADHGKVLHESVQSEDVTEAYYDMKARLDNARKLESRLLELLAAKTDGVKDLLEVERELGRVREEIERYEGKVRLYDRQVALSTLRLEIVTERIYSAAPPATLGERAQRTLAASSKAMVSAGTGLLLVVLAIAPWLLPLVLLGWLGRALMRRALRRRHLGAPL